MGDYTSDTTERDESTDRADSAPSARRRSILRALGGAGALSAFAGTGAGAAGPQSAADAAATDASTAAEARERARQNGEIDPVWGFPALSEDTEPPTSPDHEVELQIRPRDAPIPEFVFEPTGLSVEPGDTVRFSYESPHHTVTAYHPAFGYVQRVPDEVPPFSAPALPQGGYWLYTFEQSGVYELHCAPHEIFGHAMRIVVGSASGPAADPLPDLCAGQGTVTEMAGETTATGEETATEMGGGNATETATATTMPAGEEGGGGEGGQEGGEEAPSPPRLGAYAVLTDPALDPETIVEERRVSWDDLAPESKQLFVRIEGFPPC